MIPYKLTPNNRHLASFFEGIVVDEKNSILWSQQDLSSFGLKELNPKLIYPTPRYLSLVHLLASSFQYLTLIPFVIVVLSVIGICNVLPVKCLNVFGENLYRQLIGRYLGA